jgi:hypothetical protein
MVTELALGADRWPALVETLARFSSLDDDHLVRVIEVGPDLDGSPPGVFLATELANPMADTVVAGGSPPGGEGSDAGMLVRAVRDAAIGVHALHEAGIAHGSVDPHHVARTDRGGVLWPPPLDDPQGLVKRCNDWRSFTTVDPALLAGWPPDRSSDVWSLGALLHLVLSARPLYPGIESDSPPAAVKRVMFSRPQVDQAIAPDLAEVIQSCLLRNPGLRPTGADVVAEAIAACKGIA